MLSRVYNAPACTYACMTTPTELLPAQICVDALVAAEGNSKLAAERLHVPQHVLVASIAADPTAQSNLNAQLRALTTLTTFDTLRAAKAMVDAMIPEMDPADFAKFYVQLVQQVGTLTDTHESTTNVNITEVVLKMLPPNARDALMRIVAAGQLGAAPTATTNGALPSPLDDDASDEAA